MTTRVLFVDDMADMGALIVDMLQLEGIAVDWCGSGAEALERLDSGRYGVLVTDLTLGRAISGEDLLVRARELALPSLVVSGDARAIERLQGEGVEAVLKPLDVEALLAWLARHLPGPAASALG